MQTPKIPKPKPIEPQQPADTAILEADERQKLASRRGRVATIFAGSSGLSGSVARGTLLGQAQ